MAPPKVPQHWRDRVFALLAENPQLTVTAIEQRLDQQAAAEGLEDEPPSARTIGRIRDEFRAMGEQQRQQFAYVRWPATFEQGALPWDGARHVLDLLRWHQATGQDRPTVRQAKWFIRVSSVAPGLGVGDRVHLARSLAAEEQAGRRVEGLREAAEYFLAFTPWLSAEAGRYYRQAARGKHWAQPFKLLSEVLPPVIPHPEDVALGSNRAVLTELYGPAMAGVLGTPEWQAIRASAARAREQHPVEAAWVDRIVEAYDKKQEEWYKQRDTRARLAWEAAYGKETREFER